MCIINVLELINETPYLLFSYLADTNAILFNKSYFAASYQGKIIFDIALKSNEKD